jgi:hypothetical protein
MATLLMAASARADERYVFDLAKHPTTEVTLPTAPGTITIVVTNRIPGRSYQYAVAREWLPITPIPLPAGLNIATAGGAATTACVALTAAYKLIMPPADETAVPGTIKALDDLLTDMDYAMCTDQTVRKPVRDALDALQGTELVGPVSLAQGE